MEELINELKKEVRFELVYPAAKITPRLAAAKMFRKKPHQFDKLRKKAGFTELRFPDKTIWFNTKELYHYAYKYMPEVAKFFIDFNKNEMLGG